MSELEDADADDRKLPDGWKWARWTGRVATVRTWDELPAAARRKFAVRFAQVKVAMEAGQPLAKEIYLVNNGVPKVKITKPNPGWRAWCFREGSAHYITHITKGTSKGDQHEQERVQQQAKSEHDRATGLKNGGRRPKREQRRRRR